MRERLCSILPPTAHCHLAPVAAWADLVRRYYPETGPMHYVNRESARRWNQRIGWTEAEEPPKAWACIGHLFRIDDFIV